MIQYTPRASVRPGRFPNTIRDYRLRSHLTQEGLGALVGHRRTVVSSWEHGHSLPSLKSAFGLARALDTLSEALYPELYRPTPSVAERGNPSAR